MAYIDIFTHIRLCATGDAHRSFYIFRRCLLIPWVGVCVRSSFFGALCVVELWSPGRLNELCFFSIGRVCFQVWRMFTAWPNPDRHLLSNLVTETHCDHSWPKQNLSRNLVQVCLAHKRPRRTKTAARFKTGGFRVPALDWLVCPTCDQLYAQEQLHTLYPLYFFAFFHEDFDIFVFIPVRVNPSEPSNSNIKLGSNDFGDNLKVCPIDWSQIQQIYSVRRETSE